MMVRTTPMLYQVAWRCARRLLYEALDVAINMLEAAQDACAEREADDAGNGQRVEETAC